MLGCAIVLVAASLQHGDRAAGQSPSDVTLGAIALAGIAATAAFDERIARWARHPSIQGDADRHDAVSAVTTINEIPLTIGAMAVYGIGRVARQPTVADVGLHLTEALLITGVGAEVVRIGLGRARPRASPHDAFVFRPGRGLREFEHRAFPSMHASVAFATAAVLSEELRVRRVRARRWLSPMLYAAASIPGFTRLYLDQHWASDVVAGSVAGVVVGRRVVRATHRRRQRVTETAPPAQASRGCHNLSCSRLCRNSVVLVVPERLRTPTPNANSSLTLSVRCQLSIGVTRDSTPPSTSR